MAKTALQPWPTIGRSAADEDRDHGSHQACGVAACGAAPKTANHFEIGHPLGPQGATILGPPLYVGVAPHALNANGPILGFCAAQGPHPEHE